MAKSSVRTWSQFYGLDKRQARRLRRRAARMGFLPRPEVVRPVHIPFEPCMEDH